MLNSFPFSGNLTADRLNWLLDKEIPPLTHVNSGMPTNYKSKLYLSKLLAFKFFLEYRFQFLNLAARNSVNPEA